MLNACDKMTEFWLCLRGWSVIPVASLALASIIAITRSMPKTCQTHRSKPSNLKVNQNKMQNKFDEHMR